MSIKTDAAYAVHGPILGKRLFRMAQQWAESSELPGTQKDREAQIKALRSRKAVINGSRSVKAAREAVEAAAESIREVRRTRVARQIQARLGGQPLDDDGRVRYPYRPHIAPPFDFSPRPLAQGPMAERLEQAILSAVDRALDQADLDLSVSGDEETRITTTNDPRRVGMSAETYADWKNRYTSGKRYPRTGISVQITVPYRYLSRVVKPGLAVVDGMLTLDAQPVECKEPGIEIYRARWITQGRGKSVHVHDGFIARSPADGISYHGKTLQSALNGLTRKRVIANETPEEAARRQAAQAKEAVRRFVARWQDKDFSVSIADAKATGACDYGIRSWCYANDLPYEHGEASIEQVIAAYRAQPLPEARRAILHAWRRHQDECEYHHAHWAA